MKATSFSSSISANLGNSGNSQVFGQAMKKRPTGHYKKYSHFKGRDTAPAAGWGAVSLIHQLQEREHCCSRIRACATHAQFYHVTVWWMTKYFVRHCQSIYMYNLMGPHCGWVREMVCVCNTPPGYVCISTVFDRSHPPMCVLGGI